MAPAHSALPVARTHRYRSLVKRLYAADNTLWELTATPTDALGAFAVRLVSSEYWLHDLADSGEFEGEITLLEEEET